MNDNMCMKYYLKLFCEEMVAKDSDYVKYQRRDNGRIIIVYGKIKLKIDGFFHTIEIYVLIIMLI